MQRRREQVLDDLPASVRRILQPELTITESGEAVLAVVNTTKSTELTNLFGFEKNQFDYAFQTKANKKKPGKREVTVGQLELELRHKFLGPGGAREREWKERQDFATVKVLSKEDSVTLRFCFPRSRD